MVTWPWTNINLLLLLMCRSRAWSASRRRGACVSYRSGENSRLAGSAALSPGRWCTLHRPAGFIRRSSGVRVPPRPVCPLLRCVRVGGRPTQVGCVTATIEVCNRHLEYARIALTTTASVPVDMIWAVTIVWRITWKIIRIVLCCVLYDIYAQWLHAHMWVVLIGECWFRFWFSFCAFIYV